MNSILEKLHSLNLLVLIVLCISSAKFSLAQDQEAVEVFPNVSITTQSYIDSIIKYQLDEDAYVPDTNDINIAIYAYNIKDENGQLLVSNQAIYNSVESANLYFKDAHIIFHIESVTIVEDYSYGSLDANTFPEELKILHYVENAVNLYFAQNIMGNNGIASGFSYYPDQPDKNMVFLGTDFIDGNYLTNVLGTYFGLLPTHDTFGGVELVDKTNCKSSGDFLCDTYADPDLKLKVSGGCYYLPSENDPLGKFYVSSVANFMASSPDNCKCVFSNDQIKRIRYTYHKYRQYLR